jgi:hypothetical protein
MWRRRNGGPPPWLARWSLRTAARGGAIGAAVGVILAGAA